MAKLNNKGWGISNMIGFLVVFIIFLFIIGYLVYHVDHEKDSDIHLMENEYIIVKYNFK